MPAARPCCSMVLRWGPGCCVGWMRRWMEDKSVNRRETSVLSGVATSHPPDTQITSQSPKCSRQNLRTQTYPEWCQPDLYRIVHCAEDTVGLPSPLTRLACG
jgi:hypothetical protein